MATLRERAVELFFDHLRFVKNSARLYDEGDEKEALRIAVSLRVLFHQTSNSTAVLTTLSAFDCEMVTDYKEEVSATDWEVREGNKTTRTIFSGQISMGVGSWAKQLPTNDFPRKLKASEWWNATVLQLHDQVFSRREIVTLIANKDGGTHLDSLPAEYENLQQILSAIAKDLLSSSNCLLPLAPCFRLMRESANDLLHSKELHEYIKTLPA